MASYQKNLRETSVLDEENTESGLANTSTRELSPQRELAVLQPASFLSMRNADLYASGHLSSGTLQEAVRLVLNDPQQRWYYRDPAGVLRGPFPTLHMVAWWRYGFFGERLPVTEHPASGSFRPLNQCLWARVEQVATGMQSHANSSDRSGPAWRSVSEVAASSTIAPEQATVGASDASKRSVHRTKSNGASLNEVRSCDRASAFTRSTGTEDASYTTEGARDTSGAPKRERTNGGSGPDGRASTSHSPLLSTGGAPFNNVSDKVLSTDLDANAGHGRDSSELGTLAHEECASEHPQRVLADSAQSRSEADTDRNVNEEQAGNIDLESRGNASLSRRRRRKKKTSGEISSTAAEQTMSRRIELPDDRASAENDSTRRFDHWQEVKPRTRSLVHGAEHGTSSRASVWPQDAVRETEPPPHAYLEAQLRHRLAPQDSHVRLVPSEALESSIRSSETNSVFTANGRDRLPPDAVRRQGIRQAIVSRPAPWASRSVPALSWGTGGSSVSSLPPPSNAMDAQQTRAQRRSFLEIQREEEENERRRLLERVRNRHVNGAGSSDDWLDAAGPVGVAGYRSMADVLATGLTRDRAHGGPPWMAPNTRKPAGTGPVLAAGSGRASAEETPPASSSPGALLPGTASRSRPSTGATGAAFWDRIAFGSDAAKQI